MRWLLILSMLSICVPPLAAADNELSPQEADDGWLLLFDGTFAGWTRNDLKPSKRPVEQGAINPHKCGAYMMIYEKPFENFVLSLDFKISSGCNSGIFFRTWPLKPLPGKDVGYNGLEIAVDDTQTAGFHDTGAIYDLVKPKKNAMHPVGRWNHIVLTCDGANVSVELNDQKVSQLDLDEWTKPNVRPDGSRHKFPTAYADHPRKGFIGLQDHGADCWFKNIKLRVLK